MPYLLAQNKGFAVFGSQVNFGQCIKFFSFGSMFSSLLFSME